MSKVRSIFGPKSGNVVSTARRAGMAVGMEPLEGRKLLANIVWDGGPAGSGTDFNLAANWVGDVLPGPADTAVINTAGPTITLTAARSVTSVQSSRDMQVGSSGVLTTTGSNAFTASLTLSGGTIVGGTWGFSGTGNALRVTSSNGTLNNVTLNQDLVLDTTSASAVVQGTTTFPAARLTANATSISFAPGYTLNSLVSAEGATAGGRTITMAYGGTGTFTLGATGVIRLAANCGGSLTLSNSSVATILNNGLISAEAATRTLTIQTSGLTNSGTLQATAGTLTVSPTTWSNPGGIVANGAVLNLQGAWSDAGTLAVTNSTLNLDGTFTTAGLNFAGFTRSGGTVNLVGVITNTGSTLTLNAATGAWNLLGGTVVGGTLTFADGQAMVLTSSGGTYNNVTLTQELTLDATSATIIIQGTTTFPAARLRANASSINFAPGYTLNTLVSAEGATAGGRTVTMAYGGTGTFTLGAAGVIRLAAASGGGLTLNNSSAATIVNNGLISAEAAGKILTIQTSGLTNNATMRATAGELAVNPTTWSNPGSITGTGATISLGGTSWTSTTLSVTDGTLNTSGAWSSLGTVTINNTTFNAGGTFTYAGFNFGGFTRTGGVVNLSGTMTNTGSTLTLNAATGTWNLLGGAIIGGTLTFAAGQSLVPTSGGGTFSGVILSQELLINATSAYVIVQGTTTFSAARLTGNATGIYFAPGYTLNSLVSAEGATAGGRTVTMAYGGTGTFTIGAAGVIRLAANCGGNLALNNSSAATITNNGLISAEAATKTLTIQTSGLTNNTTMQATAGELAVNATTWSNPGSITGTGATITLGGTTWTSTTLSVTNGTLNTSGGWSILGTMSINNTTLNAGGTFTNAGFNFGGFTRTGGVVNLTGTLTNTSSTLTLNAATGTWNLFGGAVFGGTVTVADGQALAPTSSGGTLNNVTMSQDLVISAASAYVVIQGTTTFPAAHLTGNSTGIYFTPGYTLNSSVIAEGATAGGRAITMAYGGTGTFTIGSTGVIRLAANCGGNLTMNNSSAATIVNNGLITAEAATRTLTIQNSGLTNNGTLQATAGTLTVSPTTWSNPGGIIANGAVLNLQGAWSSAGTLSVTNATLNLDGTFSTTGFNFGGFTRSGGTVNLTGTMTNTGSTLTLNGATGSWNLFGGTLTGGTLTFAGGQSLLPTSNGGSLNSVAASQDLLIDTTSAYVVVQGTTTFPAARLTGNGTGIYFAPGYTLNTLVSAEGAAAGSRTIAMAYGGTGTFTIGADGVVRLAAGAGGNLTMSNSSAATLVNNGLISAEAATRTLTIQNSVLTNNGTLRVNAGTLTINATTWTNPGTITGTGGVVNLGGTFEVASGIGTFTTANVRVQVSGTIPNTGPGLSLTAATGSWYVAGGTINGGTITFAGNTSLRGTSSTGTLNNVTVNGDLLMDSTGANIVIQGTTTFVTARLAANAAAIYFAPGASLSGQVVVEGADVGTRSLVFGYGGTATVTIQAGRTIRVLAGAGGGLNIQSSSAVTLINNGLISNEAAGTLLQVTTTTFTNNGTLRTQNGGNIQINYPSWSNAGLLDLQAGTMTVYGSGVFTDSGTINLGPGGVLAVNTTDGLVLTSTTVVNAMIGGTALTQYGRIVVQSGNATLAGTLNIAMAGSYQPPIVSTFDVVTITQSNRAILTGFTTTVMPPPGVDGKNFMLNDSRHIKFAFSSLADFNSDAVVDFFDYLDFVQAFSTNDPTADFNNDQSIDFFDYLDFLQIFSRF